MHKFNVVNKGEYTHKQTSGALHVSRFLILRGRQCRYLLLEFLNNKDNILTGVGLQIEQYDARGNALGIVDVSYSDLSVKSGKFVLKEKIKVHHACFDFYVKVVYAEYGEYKFLLGKSGEYSLYDKKQYNKPVSQSLVKKETGKTGFTWMRRIFSKPAFICFFAIVLMCSIVGLIYNQLQDFKVDNDTFFLSNVEYKFVTEDSKQKLEVVGYKGWGGGDLVIPETVDGYPVIKVAENAFKDISLVKSVKIEGKLIIENNAFYGCSNLKSVELLDVISIGNSAFENCSKLQNVTIGDCASIGNKAFKDCSSLKTVSLPSNLERLGDKAFEYCKELSAITLPDNIRYIGSSLLYGCYSMKTISVPYFGATEGENLTVGYLFGLSNYTYQSGNSGISSEIEEITLSKQTELNKGTFYGLKKLKKVNLTDITKIEEDVFVDCYRLRYLEIPETVVSCSEDAFGNNFKLFEIENNSDNVSISAGVGAGEYAIKVYSYGDEMLEREVVNGCTFVEDDNGHWHLTDATEGGDVILPENIQGKSFAIPDYFFLYFEAENVVVNGDTSRFGDYAFYTTYIENISFKSGTHILGAGAFANNEKLLSLDLYNSTIIEAPTDAFVGNSALESISISAFTKKISADSFSGCYNLKKVRLSPLLEVIEDGTFANFMYLEEVQFYNNNALKSIGVSAFEGCANLKNITLPNSVEIIKEKAFFGCSMLTSLKMPNALITIGNFAFTNCIMLSTVEFANVILSIGDSAFYNCISLTLVSLPSTLKNLGVCCFANCSSLTSVYLSNNIENIGEYTFDNCSSLTSVVLPTSLQSIGQYAFSNCNALSSVGFYSVIESIGDYAFSNCNSLTSAILPNSLKYIGQYAFSNCSALSSISFSNQLQSIGDFAFYNCSSLASVSLPKSLSVLGGYAFSDCVGLESVSFDKGILIEEIKEGAFSNCVMLKSVNIPTNVTNIGNNSFGYCASLSYVYFANVQNIGTGAFANCSSLKELDLPKSISSIGADAFQNNVSLEAVYLRSDMSIEHNAFNYCMNLHEIYDLTGTNKVTLGSYDNGGIAFYAVVIRKSASTPRLSVYETDGFKYKYASDICALVKYTGSQTEVVLGDVVIDGRSYNYVIAPYAFDISLDRLTIKKNVHKISSWSFVSYITTLEFNGSELNLSNVYNAFNGVQNLIFDSSLKGLGSETVYYTDNLLYMGSEKDWDRNKYKTNFYTNPQRYYAECFHTYDKKKWNYTENNEINFDYQIYREKDRVDPTCTEDGSYVEYCDMCGYNQTIKVSAVGHAYSYYLQYVCEVCDEVKPVILNNSTYRNAYKLITISDVEKSQSFTIFGKNAPNEIVVDDLPNKESAVVKFTAERTITLKFDATLEMSEEESAIVNIKVNGEDIATLSEAKTQEIKVVLKQGDTVTVTFERKDVEDDNCYASLKNIEITK